MRTAAADIEAYRTLDGSRVRELMQPGRHGNRAQSLAEATIAPGQRTHLHRHLATEEIYHVLSGAGAVRLADEWLRVKPGDTVCILPGTAHCARADPEAALVILCCCSPAYRHEDTELLEQSVSSRQANPAHGLPGPDAGLLRLLVHEPHAVRLRAQPRVARGDGQRLAAQRLEQLQRLASL